MKDVHVPRAWIVSDQPIPQLLTEPFHRGPLSDRGSIGSLSFGAEGAPIFAKVIYAQFDLGKFALLFGPVLVIVLGLILLLIGGVAALRVGRRPRRNGDLYCRRCNYCVTGLPSPRCPECGTELGAKRVVVGRSMRRRLAWPAGLGLAGAVSVIAAFSFAGLMPPEWLLRTRLPIGGVGDWLARRGIALPGECFSHIGEVVMIDPATGVAGRTLTRFRAYTMLAPTPVSGTDGVLCPIDGHEPDTHGVALIDWCTGRVLGSLEGVPGVAGADCIAVSGASAEAAVVYLMWADDTHSRMRLVTWDTITGKASDAGENEVLAYDTAPSPGVPAMGIVEGPRLYCLEEGSGARWLRLPSLRRLRDLRAAGMPMEAVIAATPGGPVQTSIAIPIGDYSPALTPDGRFLITGQPDGSIACWDLATGQGIWSVAPGQAGSEASNIVLDPTGTKIGYFVDGSGQGLGCEVRISDRVTQEHLATISLPNTHALMRMAIGPGARSAALVVADRRTWKHELWLYDLTPTAPSATGR